MQRNSHYPCKSHSHFVRRINHTNAICNPYRPFVISFCSARRAAYRWARDRAKIASRWSWLLAQISDLEYRIRQHHELHLLLKMSNGQVEFEGTENSNTAGVTSSAAVAAPPTPASNDYQQLSVNGYRGILPGNVRSNEDGDVDMKTADDEDTDTNGTARTRAFKWNGFKKRKLLQSTNLHKISRRAARPWYDHDTTHTFNKIQQVSF